MDIYQRAEVADVPVRVAEYGGLRGIDARPSEVTNVAGIIETEPRHQRSPAPGASLRAAIRGPGSGTVTSGTVTSGTVTVGTVTGRAASPPSANPARGRTFPAQ